MIAARFSLIGSSMAYAIRGQPPDLGKSHAAQSSATKSEARTSWQMVRASGVLSTRLDRTHV